MNWQANEPQAGERSWYCARTQPKHEHIAAGALTMRLGLEVFHPRLRLERVTSRGPVRMVEPLFPCYVFVRCNPEKDLDQIRYISGISSLVQFGQTVPVVPDAVIEELRQCFESGEPLTAEDRLAAGTEVTVAVGALLGARGTVVRVLPARQRVQILLDFLGRTTLTDVDRKSLIVEDRSMADLVPVLARASRTSVAIAV